MSNGFELTLENLKTELCNITLKISELRKAGLDTKIAELKAMNLPYKIKLAEATKSYKDIEKINSALEDVKSELNSVESTNEKADKSNEPSQISVLIGKINDALTENKLKAAKDYYLEAVNVYNKFKNGDKKAIFGKLNEIGNKLKRWS